jgi:enoyl-CoA hydratase/carnithine racemase
MPPATSRQHLVHEIEDHVATITIDRAGKRNAIDLGMWRQLAEFINNLERDDSVRLIVITGRGPDFSAGADISEFDAVRSSAEGARDYDLVTEAAYDALRESAVPTLAAIRGSCIGGGLGLALSCDLRIAVGDAKFAIPAGRLGLSYPVKSLAHLTGIVGPAVAKDLLFTARRLNAADALQAGILTKICDGPLEVEVAKYAREIVANAPLTLKASKAAINALTDPASMIVQADFSDAVARIDACYASDDYAEGRAAFREKRSPNFTGK